MQRLPRAWILTAVLAAAVGSGPAASAASLSTPDSARLASPAVEVCGTGPSVVRPASMILTCADDGELATHLTWSSWTHSQATATGSVTWRACASKCADSKRWDSTSADVTLTHPVAEPGKGMLFTRLELHVTGSTPAGFMRDISFSEAPLPAVISAPRATSPRLPARAPRRQAGPLAASGTLGYAQIEGYWDLAGGPSSSISVAGGTYTRDQVAAAITGAESSFLPGIIQPGVDYCGAGSDRAGWGLWQITCGNSAPAQFGTNFQLLDPWNNAEAAVAKYDQAGGFSPWTTYTTGAYAQYLQHTGANTQLTDPGEYVQINATPAGTPASPPPAPGSTFGPSIPGSTEIAFQANTGFLWTDTNGSGTSQALGMAAGTSPSIATSGGVFEAAFQANDGFLWITNGGANGNDLALGMAPGTSPSITALPGGGFEIAFQANNGDLWLVGPNGVAGDTELGMAAGTSPSVAASPGGGYEVAFQANDGYLWADTNGASADLQLGMASGTSPSIAANPGGGYSIAFQANTGQLWTSSGTGVATDSNLVMAAGTSPAIAEAPGGGWEVAFQSNDGFLWTVTTGDNSANQELGMASGTSPAITPAPGGYEIAFQSNDGFLWTDTNGSGSYQALGMAPGTSPAIG